MPRLGSIRARSPSPMQTGPQFPARASTDSTPIPTTPSPAIAPPSIRLVTATPNAPASPALPIQNPSGSLAPPLPIALGPRKRVLVPKRSVAQDASWNNGSAYKPPAAWDVVGAPPPPRTVGGSHQFASARKTTMPPPPAPPIHTQLRPVAILPVKTEDGASRPSFATVRSNGSVRSTGTIRTRRESTFRADSENQEPVLVKKKSRLALDFGWALGDRTNANSDVVPTLNKKSSKSKLSMTIGRKPSISSVIRMSSEEDRDVPTQSKRSSKMSLSLSRKSSMVRIGAEDKENPPSRSGTPTPTLSKRSSTLSFGLSRRSSTARLSSEEKENAPTSSLASKLSLRMNRKSSMIRIGSEDKDKEPTADTKEKWKWSIGALGRGRKDATSTDVLGKKRSKSPSPTPAAIRNLSTFSISNGSVHMHFRSPSLEDHPPVLPPSPVEATRPIPSTVRSISPLPRQSLDSQIRPTRVSFDRPQHYRTFSASAATSLAPIHAAVVPETDAETTVASQAATVQRSGSFARRAMRSVRSISKLFVSLEDEETVTIKSSTQPTRAEPPRRDSTSSWRARPAPVSRRLSEESWVVGAATPSPDRTTFASPTRRTFAPKTMIDVPIVSASVRERMSTSYESTDVVPVEEPRTSAETFGTMKRETRSSQATTERPSSTGSTLSDVSSDWTEITETSYDGEEDFCRRVSVNNTGGRMSFVSVLSSKASKLHLPGKSTADTQNLAPKKRGSLANLFDMAASVRSSSSGGSKRTKGGSKMSVGSVASSDSGHNVLADSGYGSVSNQPLNTIPASPASPSYELAGLTPPGLKARPLPALTASQLGRRSLEEPSGDSTVIQASLQTPTATITPPSTYKARPRPMSEQLLNSWDAERRQCVVVEEPTGDIAIGMVNAATTQLSELITALDLSQTPDCSPVKGSTPRRARLISLSQGPVPPLPETVHNWARNRLESTSLKPIFPGSSNAASPLPSTFGRSAIRPQETYPPSVVRSTRRFSTQTLETMDGDVSMTSYGGDSPLKARGKLSQGAASALGKTSTGTMLNAFGSNTTSPRGSVHSEAAGNVSFPTLDGRVPLYHDYDEEYDIPLELQDLLAGRSVEGVDDEGDVYDRSIPGNASALMSDPLLESIVRSRTPTPSNLSAPPMPPPSVPLPQPTRPSRLSQGSQWSEGRLSGFDGRSALSRSTGSTQDSAAPAPDNRLSTISLHESSRDIDLVDEEEDSIATEDGDDSDNDTRSSFDFTQELNRLNKGGARQSFVKQLQNVFRPPLKMTMDSSDVPPVPVVDRSTHDHHSSLMFNRADTTVYAVANLDLSLVHPSGVPKALGEASTSMAPPSKPPKHARASSLGESLAASMSDLASMDLSNHSSSKTRPQSSSVEVDGTFKRHARIAHARAFREAQKFKQQSMSPSSYGSVVDSGAADPFSYDRMDQHTRDETMASMSSLGAVLNSGVKNPFGYDGSFSPPQDSLASEVARGNRNSMDSDRSSFYFNSARNMRHRRPRDSIISWTDNSVLSATSMHAYVSQGAPRVWNRHLQEHSRDSIISTMSDYSSRLGRPGLGDKMFDRRRDSLLYPIQASPTNSSPSIEVGRGGPQRDNRLSMESEESRLGERSESESLFDKTKSRTSSISSGSVFGAEDAIRFGADVAQSFSFASTQVSNPMKLRPLSMWSTNSVNNAGGREDDTMISMLGGERMRLPRSALGQSFSASPCVRAEKQRKRVHNFRREASDEDVSIGNEHAIEDSIGPIRFGGIIGQAGDLKRNGLEESRLSADGGDLSLTDLSQIFRRPHSESDSETGVHGTYLEAPSLSVTSESSASQPSINLDLLDLALQTTSQPPSATARLHAQKAHRRRSAMSNMSRVSIVESIAEEIMSVTGSPRFAKDAPPSSFKTGFMRRGGSARSSWVESLDWDSDFGIALRQYYALQLEAKETVKESQQAWLDTEFSRIALSSFCPPASPAAIQSLLEHSRKTFIPLPLELRVRKPRSRANSRPSPYPRCGPAQIATGVAAMVFGRHKRTQSEEQAILDCISPYPASAEASFNDDMLASPPPSLATLAPLSPFSVNFQTNLAQSQNEMATSKLGKSALGRSALGKSALSGRSLVPSEARRPTLGWSMRKPSETTNVAISLADISEKPAAAGNKPEPPSLGKSSGPAFGKAPIGHRSSKAFKKENKENEASGTLTGPNPNGSLRISRARPPRARPASVQSTTMAMRV